MVTAALLVPSGCAWFDDGAETTGPYAVGRRSMTFIDESRPTPSYGPAPAKNSRTLVTEVWYPARGRPGGGERRDAPAADDSFPLVVFNHGQQGEPEQYAVTFQRWARAGYVVAAPRHPVTVRGGPGGNFVDDMEGVLQDTSFVITRTDEELADVVDLDHVAVGGHSSGAIAAYASGFNTCCHDDRVDAVLLEALLPIPLDGQYAEDLQGTPVLFTNGAADTQTLPGALETFTGAEPPKFFLTVEGGGHSDTFRVGETAELVADISRAFFDRYLKDRDAAVDEMRRVADRSPLASLDAVTE